MSSDTGRERRADAQRNVAIILDAAQTCLAADPGASTSEIARAAGLGRVTLYGHFASRTDLVDRAFARSIEAAEAALSRVDLDGDPADALARLVASTWLVINRPRSLLPAAQRSLSAERVRELHTGPLERVQDLLERGRRVRAFRTDLPTNWMVALFYGVVHAAADEVQAARLHPDQAADLITTSLLAAIEAPR